MPEDRFDIIFAGELIEGQEPTAVRELVQQRFNSSDAQLKRLFSGKPVVIKKGVDMETAGKYRLAFRKVGALVRIRPSATPGPEDASQAQTTPLTLLPSNTGSLEEFAPKLEPESLPDISDLDLSSPGAVLDEAPTPVPARIDTGELDLVAGKEWTLEDCQPLPLPQVMPDIDDLDFAPPGDLSHIPPEPPPVPLPDIDDLDFAPPGDLSHIAPEPPPAPLPNIDDLELEEEKPADSTES